MRNVFLGAALAGVLFSCKPKQHPAEALRPQVEAFATKIETGFREGNVGSLDLHFDKGAFINRIVDDATWDQHLKQTNNLAYKEQYKTTMLRNLTLAGLFLSGIDGKKYFAYDVAKIYRIEERWHVVFRMYANDALNYHDMLLRVDSNKVWIEDVYIMAVGRQLSTIMQESYLSGIPEFNDEQRQRDYVLLLRTKALMDARQFQDALATFDSIGSEMKAQKSLRLFRVQIASNIPNEAYVRELERFEKDYPDDAGTLLLQIDKNFLYGNYPEVLKSLDRLDKLYGADPVVGYLRANALNLLGKCDEAGTLYATTLAKYPDWQEPFLNWMQCLLKDRNYTKATAILKEYEAQFGLTPTFVRYLFGEYPGLFISQPYRQWEASLTSPPA